MSDIINSTWEPLDEANVHPSPDGLQKEGAPNEIPEVIRAMKGAVKRAYQQSNAIYASTGTGNAYVLTYPQAPEGYAKGIVYWFFSDKANTGAATLNINGLGSKAIVNAAGAALTAGQIAANAIVVAVYDGSAFRMQFTHSNPALTGNVTATTFTGSGAGLTNIPANSLTGTLPNDRLSGDYSFGNLTLTGRGYAPIFEAKTPSATNPEFRLTRNEVRVAALYQDSTGLVLRNFNSSTGTGEGYIRIAGNGIDDISYNGSKIWTDANTTASIVNGKIGYVPADSTDSIVAGNGLSGGGTLAASRTITLGTPATVTNSTTNSVSATSHTHALTLVAADINGALGYTAANGANNFVAGNGLTGGGTLAAGRTFTLGTPTAITATSTNTVSATSHTHDFDLASLVYTGTSANNTVFPIGSIVTYSGSRSNRNATVTVRLGDDNSDSFWNNGSGSILEGTWRARGRTSSGENLAQRVS